MSEVIAVQHSAPSQSPGERNVHVDEACVVQPALGLICTVEPRRPHTFTLQHVQINKCISKMCLCFSFLFFWDLFANLSSAV